MKSIYKAAADAAGLSLNGYIQEAVEERMAREKQVVSMANKKSPAAEATGQ